MQYIVMDIIVIKRNFYLQTYFLLVSEIYIAWEFEDFHTLLGNVLFEAIKVGT